MNVRQTDPKPTTGDGWTRRMGRAVLRPFRPVDEVARAIDLGVGLQRSTATGRRIVVDDLGTGSDATVVAALMARALAHFRHDRVLAVDATGREPSLATRLDVEEPGDLAKADGTAFETVCEGLGDVTDRLWTARTDPADPGAYAAGLLPVSRFFGVTIAVGETGGGFLETVAAGAHSRVRVVRATREAALRVGRELDVLTAQGREDEAARTVVVVFDQERGEDRGLDVERTARIIAGSGAEVIALPHDRHLAQGTAVLPRRIAESTHRLVQTVALAALDRAIDGGPNTGSGR
ncbi:ATPase [Nocardiopsis lambiniae]|uniref:ATPase n=1 Tax=Nocardiopsis lambiniae TaxID=3075539 RepID=A0ABU2M2H3_9ACTN|nr:ATPase [Nocardiopsis sp. DSM 44743]MDT0326830.1 ATPase [Nocardiopsis sp. DSM 44743]